MSALEQYDLPDIDSITEQATQLQKTETLESLKKELTNQKIQRDTVTPSNQQFFPEEYELETETGLVKTSTISDVKGNNGGLSAEKLKKAIEKNKKEMDHKDFWYKLKHLFKKSDD